MTEKSGSSILHAYLSSLSTEAEFTAALLSEQLGVTSGSASGYLAKCVVAGAVRKVGVANRNAVYSVVDMSLIGYRGAPGVGSRPGRSITGTSGAKKAAALLRQIADQIEGFHSDLASYSNEELLKELTRRAKAGK